MKRNTALVLILTACNHWANAITPEVGHYGLYSRTTESVVYSTRKVLSSKGFDSYTVDTYLVEPNGSEVLRRRDTVPDFILESKFITRITDFCRQQNGQMEVVNVRAGKYFACKTKWENSTAVVLDWWAENVPFGLVKSTDSDKFDSRSTGTTELIESGQR